LHTNGSGFNILQKGNALKNRVSKKISDRRINAYKIHENRYKQYLDKGFIFLHIPKAAGTSINMSLYGNLALGHAGAAEYIKLFGYHRYMALFRFTFVRDPYTRIYSAYNFLKNGGMNSQDKLFSDATLGKYNDFNDFVVDGLAQDEKIRRWIHFRPQFSFLEYRKVISLDFIGRFENMDSDFGYLSRVLGLEDSAFQTLNAGAKSVQREKVLDTLSPQGRQSVCEYYEGDFDKFSYPKIT
jgi:hypothetical protein